MGIASKPKTDPAMRALWLCLLIVGGVGSGVFFACVTPFAAIATLAALKMERLEGLTVVLIVWLANQAIGFGLLGYPLTLNCAGWGLAIGISSVLALGAAGVLSPPRPVRFAVSLPFVAAFAVYELGLYVAGLGLGSEAGAFSFAVVKQVFLINLVALLVLQALVSLARALARFDRSVQPPGLATT